MAMNYKEVQMVAAIEFSMGKIDSYGTIRLASAAVGLVSPVLGKKKKLTPDQPRSQLADGGCYHVGPPPRDTLTKARSGADGATQLIDARARDFCGRRDGLPYAAVVRSGEAKNQLRNENVTDSKPSFLFAWRQLCSGM
jgi:hypothetical protein